MVVNILPSLKHAAMVSTTASLLKQHDWCKLDRENKQISKFSQAAQVSAIEKIKKLPVPENIITVICEYAWHMFRKVIIWVNWGSTHCSKISRETFFKAVCFTNVGTVDYKKSVEFLLKNSDIDVEVRFHLACICCFEDHIRELWSNINDQNTNYSPLLSENKNDIDFVKYWIHKMPPRTNKKRRRGSQDRLSSDDDYFIVSVDNNNPLAARYFWNKLSLSDKISFMYYDHFDWSYTEISYWPTTYMEFLFLTLPLVDGEQREQWLRTNVYHILKSFMRWPWCYFLPDVAERVCDYMKVTSYSRLLDNFIQYFKSWGNFNIAAQFLRVSPQRLRHSLLNDKSHFCEVLFSFLFSDNPEGAEFLVSGFDNAEKKQLVFSDEFYKECFHVTEKNLKKLFSFVFDSVSSKKQRLQWIHKFNQRNVRPMYNEDSLEQFLALA